MDSEVALRFVVLAIALAGCPRGAPRDADPGVPPTWTTPVVAPDLSGVQRQPVVTRSEAAELTDVQAANAEWIDGVRRAIDARWTQNLESLPLFRRLTGSSYVTTVSVRLDATGGVTSVQVTQPCGTAQLDDAVVQAVRASAPFGAPPAGMVDGIGATLPPLVFSVLSPGPGSDEPDTVGVTP